MSFAAILSTGCVLPFSCASAAMAEGLRAGFARVDITPAKPVMLSGYESRKGLSQGVHDPLSARVVAFEHHGQRLALVSTDILGFYGGTCERIRQAILDACLLKPEELFLSAIHTHSAPHVTFDPAKGHPNNAEYTQALQGKLVEAVRTALGRLIPVQLGVGSGSSPVGANRRQKVRDAAGNEKVVLGRNPSGPTDPEVQVLKLTRADGGQTVAVLFAYATHSTSLGPKNHIVSGDVHGLAAQFLEKQLGGDVVAPGFAGASGDIDPWFRVLPSFNTADGWTPEPILLGTLLGEEVAHVLEGIQKPCASGPIVTRFKTVELPGKPRGESAAKPDAPPSSFPISVARVGEVAFVGLGGEVFCEFGKAIKAASPFPHTFLITHCNGWAGYVPTQSSYAEGGYEVLTSPFAPGAGERLVEEAVKLLRELRDARD